MLSHFSCVLLFAAPWTVASQASLFMGFSRQEDWSGLPFPTPGDLRNPASLVSSALAGSLSLVPPGKPFVTASKVNFLVRHIPRAKLEMLYVILKSENKIK